VQSVFGRAAIPVHLPIGSETRFQRRYRSGDMKAMTFTADGDGKAKESDIPVEMTTAAEAAHEALVEMVAEGNDALMEESSTKARFLWITS